jgi:hypothetical protein
MVCEEHGVVACEACRLDALIEETLRADEPDPLTEAELASMLAAVPEETSARVVRLWPRVALAVAAAAAVMLLLLPRGGVDTPPAPVEIAEPEDPRRVEMRMATGNPSIQVIWVMDSEFEL